MPLELCAPAKPMLYCSFCGKQEHEVFMIVAGPTVYICDECVALCADLIAEKQRPAHTQCLEAELAQPDREPLAPELEAIVNPVMDND